MEVQTDPLLIDNFRRLTQTIKTTEHNLVDLKYQVYLKKVQALNQAKQVFKNSYKTMARDRQVDFMRHLRGKEQEVEMLEQDI